MGCKQIRNSEHMIQHETLALKEEKQLIRDIKQLKQLREQLSSDMGSRDEEQKVVNQKDHVEERLKVLCHLHQLSILDAQIQLSPPCVSGHGFFFPLSI